MMLAKASTTAVIAAFVASARAWGRTFSTARHAAFAFLSRLKRHTSVLKGRLSVTAQFVENTCLHLQRRWFLCDVDIVSINGVLLSIQNRRIAAQYAAKQLQIWKLHSETWTGRFKVNQCRQISRTPRLSLLATIAALNRSSSIIGWACDVI
jgi:hypothetical protein